MTHTPSKQHVQTDTKPTATGRPSLQERKERDNALVRAANALEVKARDLLHGTHPDEVEGVEEAHRQDTHATTLGPVRLALRALAREVKHQQALAVYREADGLYWALVLHWSKLLASVAAHRSHYGRLGRDYLLALYQEAAYNAALRFDPAMDHGFSTYMKSWILAREGRDPEMATIVRGPLSMRWKPEQVPIVSIDGPRSGSDPDEDGEGRSMSETLAADVKSPLDHAIEQDVKRWLAELDAHLPHEQRVILLTLYEDGTLADAGRRLGSSREWMRQSFIGIRAKVSPCGHDFRANIRHTPCRWPRCRRRATVSEAGLCLDHHGQATTAGVAEVFMGRVPSVDEVEAAVARVEAREGVRS